MKFFFSLVFFLLTAQASDLIEDPLQINSRSPFPYRWDSTQEQTLFFSSFPAPSLPEWPALAIPTQIFHLHYLGTLRGTPTMEPYFFFRGYECESCWESPQLYAVRPSKNQMSPFLYPGTLVDPKNHLILESRAFLGHCLNHYQEVLVFFQKEKVDRRIHLQPSVLILEVHENFLSEQLLEKQLPRISDTLRFVQQQRCKEIPGKKRPIGRSLFFE